jgi:predicted transcriptional regulator
MAKHRDRIEIVADVLKAAGHGTRKTRIMWMANLSYKLLRKYLDEAVTLGYLTISQEEYGVTDDGDAFPKNTSSIQTDTQVWKENWRTGNWRNKC